MRTLTELHDYAVTGLEFDAGDCQLTLKLLPPSNDKDAMYTAFFENTRSFHASGFRDQNIILDTIIFFKPERSEYFNFCNRVLALDELWSKYPGHKVFYLEPTVGLEMCCLFEDVRLNL